MLQILTIGVGLWLSTTLLIVAYLIGKNLIAQNQIMKTLAFYLSRQDQMMTQLISMQQHDPLPSVIPEMRESRLSL